MLLQIISSAEPLSEFNFSPLISIEELTELRTEYIKTKTDMSNSGLNLNNFPKNYIYYEMIKKKVTNFSWNICYDEFSNKNQVIFDAPRFNGKEVSLFSLLINKFQHDNINSKLNITSECFPLMLSHDFASLLNTIDAIYPDKKNLNAIIDWINLGLSGKELTIFSLVCPDYSVEETGNQFYPYRHTFKKLDNGVGLIAQRILNISQPLNTFLDKYNIKYKKIIALADYEALSAHTRNMVELSYEDFTLNLKSSLALINESADNKTKCAMLTDFCGGQHIWKNLLTIYECKIKNGDFGSQLIGYKQLIKITCARKKLYDRWFGEKMMPEEHLPNLLKQAAEYSTVGDIIAKNFENCLIIGADHSALSIFYSIKKFIPTIYLKRYYI
jgi:hypothetical protein